MCIWVFTVARMGLSMVRRNWRSAVIACRAAR